MSETEAADFSGLDVDEAVKMIGSVPDEQLAEGMRSEGRDAILREVFGRMEEHFKADQAKDVDAVIHWKITDGPDGRTDHWETVIKDDKCTVTDKPQHDDPRVTIQTDGVNFMKLVTGNAAGPMLFVSGKLKLSGDVPFAARMTSLFTIPS